MLTHLLRKLKARDETLSEESQDLLLSSMSEHQMVKAGETIVAQGSRPEASTLIVGGWAGRYSQLPDGRRRTAALHLNGDFVDLHSFPLKVMDHGVEAITDCVIAQLPHDRIRLFTETDPHLTRLLWLLTLIDAAILRQALLSSSHRSSLEHMAHFFAEIFTRLQIIGLAAPGRPFDLPLSQHQVGDALGITSVHVSRMNAELKARKLIDWRAGQVNILDWDALRALAEFDPTYLSLRSEAR